MVIRQPVNTAAKRLCHNCQKTVQAVSRAFLNALAEHFHAVHEQGKAAGKLKYNRYNTHDSAYHISGKTDKA